MNRFTKIAIAGALLIAPTSAFAFPNSGDQGAFFEKSQARASGYSQNVSKVAGSFEKKDRARSRFTVNGEEGAFFTSRKSRSSHGAKRSGSVGIVAGSFEEKGRARSRFIVNGEEGAFFTSRR